jgi:hypothetical protein
MATDLYGTQLYGQGIYGQPVTTSQLWALEIDWDGDNRLTGTNEAALMIDATVSRGRKYLLNSSSNGFEPVEMGYLTVTLDNDDDRYTPLNVLSELYPNVRPGVKVALQTRAGASGTKYPVFTGRIDDIQPSSNTQPKNVRISIVDGHKWLKDQDITIDIQENISIDDAISLILSNAEYPYPTSIEASSDNLRYWWVDEKNARNAIQELIDVNLGTFFVAADGTGKFYARSHYAADVLTFTQGDLNKDISTRQPWEVIKNVIKITGYPRTQTATADLWQLSDTPYVGAGEDLEIWASYNNPAINIITPVATTDFTVNTLSTGSGTDLTASCTVSIETYAKSAKITLHNGAAQPGYVTLLKIRGDAIVSPSPVQAQATDDTSKALYGPKKFSIDSDWLQDTNFIVDMANSLIQNLVNSQIYPTITLQHRSDVQFSLDLFDIITLIVNKYSINGSYQVSYIEHKWLTDNGQDVKTVLRLEPVSLLSTERWQFTTEIGLTSRFSF